MRLTICVLVLTVFSLLQACATNGNQDGEELLRIYERGQNAYQQGLLSEAESYFRQVVDKKPTFYDAWLKLGNIYVRTGQLVAAVRMYEKCTDLKPNDVRAWKNLTLTRWKQALATLDQAQAHFPPETDGYRILKRTREDFILRGKQN